MPMNETIRRVLTDYRTWAVVGCSPDPSRDSNMIARLLIDRDYEVIPVNPTCDDEILGRRCYPSLEAIDRPVEVVDIFRRSDQAGAHVDEAIAIGANVVCFQLGVVDHPAAQRARAAGLDVVENSCPKIELPQLAAR
jgi:uncharacterized protein